MGTSTGESAYTGGCLSLFGLPFLIVGLFLSVLYFNGYQKWLTTQRWVETPCWIETAELETSQDDGTTYKAKATYRYEYQGNTYRSSDVSLYSGSDNVGDFQQDAYFELAQYAESLPRERNDRNLNPDQRKPFRCFVNPSNPQQAVIYRVFRWQLQSLMSIFALSFPAIGSFLVLGGIWTIQNAKEERKLKEDFPDEPWRWKTIWARETIPEHFQGRQRAIDLYVIWSAAIITPLILVSVATGAFSSSGYAWLLLILVGLWFLPAMATWRGLRKRWSIGSTQLKLETPFGEPGRILAGEILLGSEVEIPEKAKIALICEKIVTVHSSDSVSTFTEIVWRSENDFTGKKGPVRQLPFSFEVPIHAKESSVDGNTEYQWKVKLDWLGPKVQVEFEVPIFQTQASRILASENPSNDFEEDEITNDQLRDRLSKDGIEIRFDDNDRLQSLICTSDRHKTLKVFLCVFYSIWTLIAVVLIVLKANGLLQVFWGATSIVLWASLIWWAFHRRTVQFEDQRITVTNEVGPWKRTVTFDRQSLSEVSHCVGMHSGKKRYFQVQFKSLQGKKIILADGISEEAAARKLANSVSDWSREKG
jgi:Protein of unknown function (DUF3592)